MTWALSVITQNNVQYDLSDNQNYVLTGIDGIGPASVMRISEQGPMQHGVSDLGYRLRPRRMALALLARGGDTAAWFARREELSSIFRSNPMHLRIMNGAIIRQIDCHLSGMMEMPLEAGVIPGWQRVGIELYAPDPTWYDPTDEIITFQLSYGGLLSIPLTVPMSVGASTIDSAIEIAYTGTWNAYPIITLEGPMISPVITNVTTGDKLDLTDTSIADGDSYKIDCRYGYKTVTRTSDGANRIQDLTDDSNLATFHIGADPDVEGGNNIVRVTAKGLTGTSVIYIQYNTRYVGV